MQARPKVKGFVEKVKVEPFATLKIFQGRGRSEKLKRGSHIEK
jgi:hypothetical protein